MSKTPGHTQLDDFIKEMLKSADADMPVIDWSEIEVLLPRQQKSISIGISKKAIMISFSFVVIAMVAFGVFKIARYYSSLPAETKNHTDSTNPPKADSITDTSDEQDSAFVIPGITYKDSFVSAKGKQKTDSASAVISADTTSVKKTNAQPVTVATKIIQQQNPKQKQDKVKVTSFPDTSSKKIHIEHQPAPDTVAAKPIPREIKIENPPIADTTNKKIPIPQKKSKNRKSKSQKRDTTQPDASPPPEAKPDTSKKQ